MKTFVRHLSYHGIWNKIRLSRYIRTSSGTSLYFDAFDPREIIVMGYGPEISQESLKSVLNINVKDRLENPLDDIIESDIGRSFGVLIS
ncbi:MAG: hypothetical protein ACP5C3_06165 [Methanomicrobiales archaeon]